MKIGVLAPYSRPWDTNEAEGSGMNVFIRESAEALSWRGHKVTVFRRASRSSDKKTYLHHFGVRERTVRAGRRTRLGREEVFKECAQASFPQNEVLDCDVLIAHYWIVEAWVSQLIDHYHSKILYFSHSHFWDPARVPAGEQHKQAEIRLLQNVIWCANSRAEYNNMVQITAPENLVIIPPGTSQLRPRRLSNSKQKDRYLFIGRKNQAKGYDLFYRLAKEFPESSFFSVGRSEIESPELPNLKEVEYLPLSELAEYISKSKCVICPSRYENFGLVPLLALSQNTPVIAPRLGGFLDTVAHQKTGLFYNGSYQGLKLQFKKIITGSFSVLPAKKDQLLANFSWERFVKRVEETILCVENIYNGAVLSVSKRPIMTTKGHIVMFEQVSLSGSVHVLPITAEGKILLLSEHRYDESRTRTKILSGIVERGETSEEAASRELQEELGLKAGRMEKLIDINESTSVKDTRTYYIARDLSVTSQRSSDENESIYGSCEFDVETLYQKALEGAFGASKSVLAIIALRSIVKHGTNPFK